MTWLYCILSFLVGVIVTFRVMWVVICDPLMGISGSLGDIATTTMRTNIDQRKIISDLATRDA